MQTEIKFSPAFAAATVRLDAGESVQAEAGAMVAMSPGMTIQTDTRGGFMKGLKRSVLGGESFFMNTFHADQAGAELVLAPTLPGDIVQWDLTGQTVYLASGCYLASATTVDVDSKWGGAKSFFGADGLFMLRLTGSGLLLVSSYGAIQAMELAPGQQYTVDTGHMVGWGEGVQFEVKKFGGWKSTILGGEGLVVQLTGPGRIYLQTRSAEDFLGWLIPKLPKQTGN